MPAGSQHPRVTVLLATHNGARYLGQQLDSILSQQGVQLRVLAADDASSDDTALLLRERAASDPRLRVVVRERNSGGAAASFFELIRGVDDDGSLVAFADQDDIWHAGKLARHAQLMREHGADGVSSNVIAFDEGGRRTVIRKDYPQRRFDFLLEGPGPGCTHLLSSRLIARLRALVQDPGSAASRSDFHDWLDYAVCRALGWTWMIDPEPSVDYRQHSANAFGANVGVRSAASRLSLMRSGWHRRQAALMGEVAAGLVEPHRAKELDRVRSLIDRTDARARLALAVKAWQLRRRPRDRLVIAALLLVGRW